MLVLASTPSPGLKHQLPTCSPCFPPFSSWIQTSLITPMVGLQSKSSHIRTTHELFSTLGHLSHPPTSSAFPLPELPPSPFCPPLTSLSICYLANSFLGRPISRVTSSMKFSLIRFPTTRLLPHGIVVISICKCLLPHQTTRFFLCSVSIRDRHRIRCPATI